MEVIVLVVRLEQVLEVEEEEIEVAVPVVQLEQVLEVVVLEL